MEYFIICLCAFAGSLITFFSGFGLGTVLMPVFGLFFPIDTAIALTAIVHFLNNIFKFFLIRKEVNYPVVLSFGVPAFFAAMAGAWLLGILGGADANISYTLSGKIFNTSALKICIGSLLILFAAAEVIPALKSKSMDKKYVPLGGLLTGFFGGLSGNQGAMRSAFLIKLNLEKEAFIATGIFIALLVDVSRLGMYSGQINSTNKNINYTLLIIAVISAFAGAYLGKKFLKKVSISAVENIVSFLLFSFAICLGLGMI